MRWVRVVAALVAAVFAMPVSTASASTATAAPRATAAAAPLPSYFSLVRQVGPMPALDQGSADLCVPYAWTLVAEYLYADRTGRHVAMDPQFTATRGMWSTALPAVYTTRAADGSGDRYRLQLTGDPLTGADVRDHAAVKQYVLAHRAAIIVGGYPSALTSNASRVVSGPLGAPQRVWHAMALLGFGSRGLLVQNSWGPSWGRNGRAWLSWAYVDNYVVDIEAAQLL